MSTTIQNNPPVQIIGSTRDLPPKDNVDATAAALDSFLAPDKPRAKSNNQLAHRAFIATTSLQSFSLLDTNKNSMVPIDSDTSSEANETVDEPNTTNITHESENDTVLTISPPTLEPSEETLSTHAINHGPTETTITTTSDRFLVKTKVDADNNDSPEFTLNSSYDKQGNLQMSEVGRDTNGDGELDSLEAFIYESQIFSPAYISRQKLNSEGTHSAVKEIWDSDQNGKIDLQIVGERSNQGGWLNRTISQDINEDGILDIAIHETFDEHGNKLTHSTEVFEEGMFGANATKDVNAVTNEDALFQIPNDPSKGSEDNAYVNLIGSNEEQIRHTVKNTGEGLSVEVKVDFNDDRIYDASYGSTFNQNGSLKEDFALLDKSGNGNRDYSEKKRI